MKTAIQAFRYLTKRERTSFFILIAIRVILTALDLAGLALLGLATSLLSNSQPSALSISGRLIAQFKLLGFTNVYASIGAMAIAFFILKAFSSVYLNKIVTDFCSRTEAQHAEEIFAGFLKSGLIGLDRWSTKEVFHGVSSSSTTAFGQALSVLSIAIGEVSLLMGVSIFLCFENFGLFLTMATVFTVFGLGLNRFVSRKASALGAKVTRSSIDALAVVGDALALIKLSKQRGMAELFRMKFGEVRQSQAKAAGNVILLGYVPRYAFETMMMVCFGALLIQRSLDNGNLISANVLAVFVAGGFRIVGSMLPLQASLTNLKIINEDAKNALAMLDFVRSQKSQDPAYDSSSTAAGASIALTDANFSFPGSRNPVLSGANLQVDSGEAIGIIGPSGQGKSTLADLLLGLRTLTSGELCVTSTSGRKPVVAYVPQTAHIFKGTVMENCLLRQRFSEEDYRHCQEVLASLDMWQAIEGLPEGLHTVVGDGGVQFSGGQSQRIGIARALLVNPDLVIFDEITSALDPESTGAIVKVLARIKRTMTMVIIAHRAETLSVVDRTYELKNGKLSLSKGAYSL